MGLLLGRLVQVLWEREHQRRTAGWVSLAEMTAALAHLAFAAIDADRPTELPLDWALAQLAEARPNSSSAMPMFKACHAASLIDLGVSQMRFSHQLIQEYFAAIELKRIGIGARLKPLMLNLDTGSGSYRLSTKWDLVLIALCGLDPERADEALIEIANIDTALAVRCIRSGLPGTERGTKIVLKYLIQDLTDQWDDDRHWPAADALAELGAIALPAVIGVMNDPKLQSGDVPFLRVIENQLKWIFFHLGDAATSALVEIAATGNPAARRIAAEALKEAKARKSK
jgi:hypothetical protein